MEIKKGLLDGSVEKIARLCDLCGNFALFAVKESTFLQFPKTEP